MHSGKEIWRVLFNDNPCVHTYFCLPVNVSSEAVFYLLILRLYDNKIIECQVKNLQDKSTNRQNIRLSAGVILRVCKIFRVYLQSVRAEGMTSQPSCQLTK
jgi:hypothetical protein